MYLHSRCKSRGARHQGSLDRDRRGQVAEVLGEARPQQPARAGSQQEGTERDQRRDHRQAPAAGDPEAQQDDVAGHVGREDVPDAEERLRR